MRKAALLSFFFFAGLLRFGFTQYPSNSASPSTASSDYHYIKAKELRHRLTHHQHLVLFDVRSAYAYQNEHIKGAISLPLPEIRTSSALASIPTNQMIVTYCSCPHHLAQMAADVLGTIGYHHVFVLDEGLPGWKSAGYPMEGTLANKPVSIYWIIGYVFAPAHKPVQGLEIRVLQPATEQLEFGKTGNDGFYAIRLPFYGLKPGDQLQVSFGGDTIFFSAGEKTNPWGIRVDDEMSHIVLLPNQFLHTFKSRRLHP